MFSMGMVLFIPDVFAEEGDFYDEVIEKYESEAEPSQIQIENLESYMESIGLDKYDYESNTIDCSWYDVNCHVNGNFIFTNMVGLVSAGTEQIDKIIGGFANFDNTDDENIQGYKDAFQSLSLTMAAIFLLYQAMRITVLYLGESDDGMNVLQEKLWLVLAVGILLGTYNYFYDWILEVIRLMSNAISTTAIDAKEVAISLVVNGALYGIILALFLAVILIVFALAYLYRFALFTLLFITGVIAIPTMLNDTYNFFSIWLRTLISNGLTFILQTLCYALGFNQLTSLASGSFMYAIAFFILALSISTLLGQFGSSSGSSRALASGAKTVIRYGVRR